MKLLHLLFTVSAFSFSCVSGALAQTPAAFGSVFNPDAFTSLGTLSLSSGSVTFNTDSLAVTGAFSGTGVQGASQSGNTTVAVFTFSSVSIASGVTVNVVGSRPMVLASQTNLLFGGAFLGLNGGTSGTSAGAPGGAGGANGGASNLLNSNAGTAQSGFGPGGGGGGSFTTTVTTSRASGGGGAYGGAGGAGSKSGTQAVAGLGGASYGNAALTELLGGSGGGGGRTTNSTASNFRGGAGGGGALELVADLSTGVLTLESTAQINLNGGNGGTSPQASGGGGSGGGLILASKTLALNNGFNLSVAGGQGGISSNGVGGGGGGGGRVAFYTDTDFSGGAPAGINLAQGNAGTGTLGNGSGGSAGSFYWSTVPVPEPSGSLMILSGLGILLLLQRRRGAAGNYTKPDR